jgi:hypothetical protein
MPRAIEYQSTANIRVNQILPSLVKENSNHLNARPGNEINGHTNRPHDENIEYRNGRLEPVDTRSLDQDGSLRPRNCA